MATVLTVPAGGWFRRTTEYIGFVVRLRNPLRIIGEGVRGRRDKNSDFVCNFTLSFN